MATRSAIRDEQGCCSIEHSDVVEDYLKSVFHLCTGDGRATTSGLAGRLQLSPPTVSAMLKRLEAAELVRRSSDQAVHLTDHGQRHALSVVRRHRLLEMFLVEVLDVPWDAVHAEAEVLEHALSTYLEERIDALLGRPSHDPHGDPIPPAHGEHVEDWGTPLAAAPAGSAFLVQRVSDRDSDALRHLAGLGIVPGTLLQVLERAPFDGPLWVELHGERHALGGGLVRHVHGQVR